MYKGTNGGDIPITRYFEMDVAFLGLTIPTKKKTKNAWYHWVEPEKVGASGISKEYLIEVFNRFQCPQNIGQLLFSQLYVYYYTDIRPAVVNEVTESDCVYTESKLLPNWMEM